MIKREEVDAIYAMSLGEEHLNNARLFANRTSMIRFLSKQLRHGNVAEIGVLFGHFSRVLLDKIEPSTFDAYDIFTSHQWDTIWGKPAKEWFHDKTHLDFYRNKFSVEISKGILRTFMGDGADNIRNSDILYDMVYIDGDHSFESVLRDAEAAISRLKKGGILIFNDYTFVDPITDVPYGIVQVVNDLCVNKGWRVIGFALEGCMFADIAIQHT